MTQGDLSFRLFALSIALAILAPFEEVTLAVEHGEDELPALRRNERRFLLGNGGQLLEVGVRVDVKDRGCRSPAAGRVRQELVPLAWSYTHMHCNRLGIDPVAEAILRYFMHRLMQERIRARA